MNLQCVIFAIFLTMVNGFDLGPSMRIAQCRSLCLRRHHELEQCQETQDCYTCWETCGLLENDWTVWGSVCQDDKEICFAGCKTACAYHATRVEEQFLPSTLPAPMVGPVYLEAYDVAILFKKIDEDWEEMNQYHGQRVMALNKTTWIVVVAENGVRQYSGEFWKPNLETLKEGAFFEASLSWNNVNDEDNEVTNNSDEEELTSEILNFNSRISLDFENDEVLKKELKKIEKIHLTTTENYSKLYSTLITRKSPADIGKIKLYLGSDAKAYFDEQNARILSDVSPKIEADSEIQNIAKDDDDLEESDERAEIYKEEPVLMVTTSKNSVENTIGEEEGGELVQKSTTNPSYIVSWEPEAGGLMGNQVTDAKSTQISLLPGTKYLVRIASNDGPGSFALEIDTTIKTVEFAPLESVAENFQPWAILAGCMSALTLVTLMVLVKICRRTTSDDKLDYV